MNVLCLFQKFSFDASTIYLDLINELKAKGHEVFVIAGTSSETIDYKSIDHQAGVNTAYVKLPDQFHTDKIRKGLIQLTIGWKMLLCAKKFFWNEKIDIIIYPTPPITLAGILPALKSHYGAVTYLMLKDIFPQNAVDLKMMSEGGLLHKYFRNMERKLYRCSDKIGCMSQANIAYVKSKNPEIPSIKLELFPNTVRILPRSEWQTKDKTCVRFVFGGNLGKPQAIDFLMEGIRRLKDFQGARFTIIGDGTEVDKVRDCIKHYRLTNVRFEKQLPRDEYEQQLSNADVGLVMLSPDFTIPNYPSRILSYMQMSKPILAVTDRVTDIHALVTYEARCGWWCASDDVDGFVEQIKKIYEERDNLTEFGENGRNYLEENFDVARSVEILENAVR
ncbi:MAG: glycosyltransferase family 4 protein [Lachnospiraceae bacterium]|nr:glycosyltransferase family 4 protein [Lachnospiraceae bacterium]